MKDEEKKGNCATAVECYMKEYNMSSEKASKEIQKICGNAWKDINEVCMKPTAISRPILEVLINLVRTTEVIYRFGDAYTYASTIKPEVTSLFIDPIPI